MYTSNQSIFTDFFRNLADWSVLDPSKINTNYDVDSLMQKNKKHAKAVTETHHLMMSNMQAIIQRQAEILQDNTSRLLNCCKKLSTLGKTEQVIEEQTNFIKDTMAINLANTRELIEMTTKAQIEVMDHLGHEISENMNEHCSQTKTDK
ncbi:MAG: phasin family protein [Alphaproteobacteria bacterium]|jgi:phasin family protein